MELLTTVLKITEASRIHEFCCCPFVPEASFSYNKNQCLLWAYCTISFDIISFQSPPKQAVRSLRRHWSNTFRNMKAILARARVLQIFYQWRLRSLLYVALPLTMLETTAFAPWETTKAYVINLDYCAKSRSPHHLVPAQLGKGKGGQERVDLYKKRGGQPHGPWVWQHFWLYTRWRAPWCWAFQTLNQHSLEFLAMEFKFNSF